MSAQATQMLPMARGDVVLARVGNERVRFDAARDRAPVLNLTAAVVWTYCDGERRWQVVRGHSVLGDDLVRFAPGTLRFSAVYRSLKLDDKSLSELPLIAYLWAVRTVGTFLAAGYDYVSPAAIRRGWQAPEARPEVVVLFDRQAPGGPARLERMSEGEAAVLGLHERLRPDQTDRRRP